MTDLINNLTFIFERMDWLSLLDLLLVALVFFSILRLLRDTQALILLRGILLLIALMGLLTSLEVLPAFSWLMRTTLPALLFAIPLIFAPEIRRALERLGRAGAILNGGRATAKASIDTDGTVEAVVSAVGRLADRHHGALIVLQRLDNLQEYLQTGVVLNARVTAELLLQVFYPNTPLHDGAAIIFDDRLVAAACVMPLSASGVLSSSPERQMGLRHRAALGISEVSDAIAVVVSEETGSISIVQAGHMMRGLDLSQLEHILQALYRPKRSRKWLPVFFARLLYGRREAG